MTLNMAAAGTTNGNWSIKFYTNLGTLVELNLEAEAKFHNISCEPYNYNSA